MNLQANWGMIGHEWAVKLLKNHIAQKQTRHAYLFTGPQGIGKRTLGLKFTQAVNCPNSTPDALPCEKCITCKRIQDMVYPDLNVVQAEQVGGVLKVEQIRELQHSLSLAPYEGKYRIALLLRFEEAHISASNALLKTLEEPNPQVILILTAESPELLLPTIVSRCEIIRLRPASIDSLTSALHEHMDVPQADARFLAHIANGRPGLAVKLHNHPDQLEKRLEVIEELCSLLNASRVDRFEYAQGLANDKEAARITLQTWVIFWRDILLKTTTSTAPLTNLDQETKIEAIASQLDTKTTYEVIKEIETTLDLMDRNVNLRLAIEVMLLKLPRLEVPFPS